MSPVRLMLIIVTIGVLTFALRFAFIGFSDRLSLPPLFRRGLVYVPPAVLSAIVFQDIFVSRVEGEAVFNLRWDNPLLISGISAIIAAWFSKNVLVTMIVGLGVLWSFRLF